MKPFEQQTYYELLEIPVTAPDEEIRAAYARAIETYSPDSVAVYALVDPGQVDALRARLTEAMEILTDSDLRAEYDRMIGVNSASAVVTLTPALAAAAQAVQPEKSSTPEAAPTPAPEPASPVVAPAAVTSAAPEASATPAEATSAPAQTAPEAEPAPVAPAAAGTVAPGQVVLPNGVTPSQIHAAFRSYSISYVPVLVPAPSLNAGSAFFSPFTAPAQPDAAPPAQEAKAAVPSTPAAASAPEGTSTQTPPPAAEPAPAATPTVAAATESAPRSESATPAAPAVSAEPITAPSAPATPPATEKPQATPAQAAAEPSHPPEPAPAPPTEQPAPESHPAHEAEELSGARAPSPTREEARPVAGKPATAPVSQPGRHGRPTHTPPPLPPGGRRLDRSTPVPVPGASAGEAGKASARPGSAAGMNLEEAQQIAQESAIATAEAALAQVAAKAREPRPKPVELPPNTEFNGELLRRVRESRNLSLAQLAERTRISTKHLENVEADRYAALPATVYLRGILMNIARELTLDPLRVSRSYLALAADPKKK